VTIALAVVALFANLYPNVMPSTTDPAFSLTVTNASSTELTLQIMTVVAVIFTPIVLLYEGWSYWMFRQRVVSPRVTSDTASLAGGSLGGRAFRVPAGDADPRAGASGPGNG
jgi:cytochrome d ubiquinol oxidase subunit II